MFSSVVFGRGRGEGQRVTGPRQTLPAKTSEGREACMTQDEMVSFPLAYTRLSYFLDVYLPGRLKKIISGKIISTLLIDVSEMSGVIDLLINVN